PEKVAKALSALPTLDKGEIQRLTRPATAAPAGRRGGGTSSRTVNPQRTGFLFEHETDLYYCSYDGTKAVRLTHTPGAKELVSFSPDGQFVAFVREHNLCVVDIATQTERALTTDGSDLVSNGKADWVYLEEVFNRSGRGYWWSPDSRQ